MTVHFFIKMAVVSGFFLALSACATGLSKVDYPTGTDPQAKLDELQLRLNQDQAKQVGSLSSSRFDLAERFLAEAQDRLDGDQTPESILEDAGYAAAQLQEIEKNGGIKS